MTDMIAAVLEAGAWSLGVLLLLTMAALPLLERLGAPGDRR
jgi:hypothetical protein